MNVYFIVLMTFYTLNLGISIAKHGEERKDKYNALITLISLLLNTFLIVMAIKTGF